MKSICLILSVLFSSVTLLHAQVGTLSSPTRMDTRDDSGEEAGGPVDSPAAGTGAPARWEVSASAGLSQFATPAFEHGKIHTRRNASQFTGALTLGRYFRPWLQAGVSVSLLEVSYLSDAVHDGSLPQTYNTVYLASPMIPVQLFAKAYIGGETGFRSGYAVLAGYALVRDGHIDNAAGKRLNATPGTGNCFVAGFQASLDYFFNRHLGLGASGTIQRFWMKSHGADRPGFIFPVTAGVRYRF
jgi:hypothetical protein